MSLEYEPSSERRGRTARQDTDEQFTSLSYMCHDCLIYDCLICAMAVLYVTFAGLDCLMCDVLCGTQRGDGQAGHSNAESSYVLLSSLELIDTIIYEP